MTEQEFDNRMKQLMAEISTLPAASQPRMKALAEATRDRHERLRASVSKLNENLDYLRVSVKYLVFDLEATRRENASLRQMLDGRDADDEV